MPRRAAQVVSLPLPLACGADIRLERVARAHDSKPRRTAELLAASLAGVRAHRCDRRRPLLAIGAPRGLRFANPDAPPSLGDAAEPGIGGAPAGGSDRAARVVTTVGSAGLDVDARSAKALRAELVGSKRA